MPDDTLWATKQQLARLWRIGPSRIDDYVDEGMDVHRRRVGRRYLYDVVACDLWRKERYGRKSADDKRALAEARIRKEAAQAELAELELQRRRGEVAPVTSIDEVIGDIAARLDSKVSAFPRKWAPELLGIEDLRKMVDELDRGVEELRAELRGAADK